MPWINPQIKQLMRKRDYHKKQAIKHDSETQWALYKAVRNKVNIDMRKAKSKYFCDRIETCSQMKDSKNGWAWINTLLGRKRKNANINELIINDKVISDDKIMAETFNEYFINIGMKMAAESGNQSTDTCNSERDVNPPKEYFHFSDITVDNVFIRLQKLNASKATGMDGIPAKILKMIASFIAPSLTFIFNLSIRTGTYIDEWKLARVILIYKSEDKRKCENYRPISVLPIVSKIFEGEVFSQIYSFLNRHAPLSIFQSGFRPKHGTLAALIQMCDQWQTDMDDGKINGVVFLDICKAFDSVNHQILLEKLETQFGIHDTELKWFQSYLKDRKQVCFVNEQTSSARKIICGIPQGSILGPLLFLLYINDMPDILEKTTPCLYADDTQIYSSSHDYDTLVENLNMDLANIQKWLAKNKLKSHAKKTKVMFIGSLHNLNNKVGNRTVEMNKIPVPQTNTFKCLGVDLDQKLNWEKHIDSVCHKISAGIGAMKRIKPYVPHKTLQDVYKTLIQPHFDYCSPLWDNCGLGLQDKLQKFQNRAAREITGADYDVRSSEVLNSLGWEKLANRRALNKLVFIYKVLENHTAPNLKDLFSRRNVSQNSYELRNSETDLSIKKPKTEFLKKTFGYSGAVLWNSLPQDVKMAESLISFKTKVKLHLS